MVLIPLILLFLPLGLHFDLLNNLAEWSQPAAQFCVKRVAPGPYHDLFSALCCGAALPKNSPEFQIFRHLGLVHLLVVSGMHLLIIERGIIKCLGRCPYTRWVAPLVMLIFAAACQFAPPVTRALGQRWLGQVGRRLASHWPPSLQVLLSGGALLALFPQWGSSLSLQLSWVASLLICLPLTAFRQALLLYFGLMPLLWPLGVAHPLSLVISSWTSTLLLVPLLVLAWFTWLIPASAKMTTQLTHALVGLVEHLTPLVPPPLTDWPRLPPPAIWVYLGLLHFVVYLYEVRGQRSAL